MQNNIEANKQKQLEKQLRLNEQEEKRILKEQQLQMINEKIRKENRKRFYLNKRGSKRKDRKLPPWGFNKSPVRAQSTKKPLNKRPRKLPLKKARSQQPLKKKKKVNQKRKLVKNKKVMNEQERRV